MNQRLVDAPPLDLQTRAGRHRSFSACGFAKASGFVVGCEGSKDYSRAMVLSRHGFASYGR